MILNTKQFLAFERSKKTLLRDITMRVYLLVLFLFSTTYSFANNHNFKLAEINQDNLVANLYLPNNAVGVPVVIVIGGSSGGMRTERGEFLAKHGIAALTLAYFRYKELPQRLDNIPVEYVSNAIDYLQNIDVIDKSKVGVWGASRGSELAFLAASYDPRIKALVATTPSKVAWHGMTTASAWSYQGKPVPALSFDRRGQSPIIQRSAQALTNLGRIADAQFKFEQINGPILLISAEQDHIWPSFQMAKDIEGYTKKHNFKHLVTHHSYPTGHFFSEKVWPNINQSIVAYFYKTFDR